MLVPSLLEAPTRKIISIQIIDWVREIDKTNVIPMTEPTYSRSVASESPRTYREKRHFVHLAHHLVKSHVLCSLIRLKNHWSSTKSLEMRI
jgi:hypothetical protein